MSPNEPRARRILGGAAILAALLGSAFLILALDDLLQGRRETFRVVGIFTEAAGVQSGTPVWVAGREVGEVVGVSFVPPTPTRIGVIALDLRIPTEHRSLLRGDSEIRLGPPQPLAPPVVRIAPGSAGVPALDPGDTLWARDEDLLRPLQARVPTLRQEADTLVDRLGALFGRVEHRRRRLDPLLTRSEALGQEIRMLESHLSEGAAGAALRREGLAAEIRRLREQVASLRAEIRLPLPGSDADPAWAEARRSLEESAAEARAAFQRVDSLAGSAGGTLGRFRADGAIAREIAATREALDSLVAELRAAPHRLFF